MLLSETFKAHPNSGVEARVVLDQNPEGNQRRFHSLLRPIDKRNSSSSPVFIGALSVLQMANVLTLRPKVN